MKRLFIIISFVAFIQVNAQYNGKKFAVYLNYTYTNSSKLYLNPKASDIEIRNQYLPVGDIFSQSIDIRYRLNESIIIGLSSEIINKTVSSDNYLLGGIRVSIEDGYEIIPIELSSYYFLPFSTENLKFYMGGGLGMSFGKSIRSLGDVKVLHVKSDNSPGIHVALGMDYIFFDGFSVRTELKFRDPVLNLEGKYSNQIVNIDGRTIRLSSEKFFSKVNVDGINARIGLVINIL